MCLLIFATLCQVANDVASTASEFQSKAVPGEMLGPLATPDADVGIRDYTSTLGFTGVIPGFILRNGIAIPGALNIFHVSCKSFDSLGLFNDVFEIHFIAIMVKK